MEEHQTLSFYDELADYYHLIFDDWDAAIERQARVLQALLSTEISGTPLKLLDCACGIGTQALGFAMMGHQVTASDISPAAVARARDEAASRSLDISFHVSDITDLREIEDQDFDVVAAMDNALPHLAPAQLGQAARAVAAKLKPGGLFMASIRDYDRVMVERPGFQEPSFFGAEGSRRIVRQAWKWIDERTYVLELFIQVQSGETQSGSGWKTHHFVSEYQCVKRAELTSICAEAGFNGIRWLMPAESGFYQPILLARRDQP